MEINKYSFRKYHKGAYVEVNKIGRYYNVLLFVQSYSKKIKSGEIILSNKPFDGSIKIVKGNVSSNPKHYYIDKWEDNFTTPHLTIDFSKYIGKTLFIKVIPKKLN